MLACSLAAEEVEKSAENAWPWSLARLTSSRREVGRSLAGCRSRRREGSSNSRRREAGRRHSHNRLSSDTSRTRDSEGRRNHSYGILLAEHNAKNKVTHRYRDPTSLIHGGSSFELLRRETRVSFNRRHGSLEQMMGSMGQRLTSVAALAICVFGAYLIWAVESGYGGGAEDAGGGNGDLRQGYGRRRRMTMSEVVDIQAAAQEAAFRQFGGRRTGEVYNVTVDAAAAAGTYQAIRLRTGSLKRHAVELQEFYLPAGCRLAETPGPERLLLVYAKLLNLSSLFPNLPDNYVLSSAFAVSLLAYDAASLNSSAVSNLPSLALLSPPSPQSPISVRFSSSAADYRCAAFDLTSAAVNYSFPVDGACLIDHLGVFGTAAIPSSPPSPPPPPPSSSSRNTWKIAVGSAVGGLAAVVLVAVLAVGVGNSRRNAKFAGMEQRADQGETLQTAVIRHSRAPAAADTRTQPSLERDYTV